MNIPSGKGSAVSSALQGKPISMNEFASLMNASTPYSFNMVSKPDWFNGTYNWTQVRPMGATFLHPEGVSEAYKNAKSSGMLSMFENEKKG